MAAAVADAEHRILAQLDSLDQAHARRADLRDLGVDGLLAHCTRFIVSLDVRVARLSADQARLTDSIQALEARLERESAGRDPRSAEEQTLKLISEQNAGMAERIGSILHLQNRKIERTLALEVERLELRIDEKVGGRRRVGGLVRAEAGQ